MVGLLLGVLAAGGAGAQTVTDVPPTASLQITVYQGTGALVSDRRTVELQTGENELHWQGVPLSANDTSLDLQSVGGQGATVLGRGRTAATQRPSEGLQALIGQQVTLVRRADDGTVERLAGTLLSVTDRGRVGALQVADVTVLDPVGEVEVTAEQLATLQRPDAVVWRVQAAAAGPADLQLTYLVPNGNWVAHHTVMLSGDASSMDLTSWASVSIEGSEGLTGVGTRLVSGSFAALGGTSALTIDGPARFGRGDGAQVTLAGAEGLPVANLLLFDGGTLEGIAGDEAQTGPVVRAMRFANSPETKLGVPLPGGDAIVYQTTPAGVKLISQTTMPPSIDGDTVDLRLGEVGGLRGSSVQESWRQLSPEDIERKCAMVIANTTDTDRLVTCGVTMSGQWRISESTHEYGTRAGDLVEFTVPAPAKRAAKLEYTVRIELPSDRARPSDDSGEAPPLPPDNPTE